MCSSGLVVAEENLLSSVLVFATCFEDIPVGGFEAQPQLLFGHPEDLENPSEAAHPFANTCALQLRIPIMPNYNEFSEVMRNSIAINVFTTE